MEKGSTDWMGMKSLAELIPKMWHQSLKRQIRGDRVRVRVLKEGFWERGPCMIESKNWEPLKDPHDPIETSRDFPGCEKVSIASKDCPHRSFSSADCTGI